MITARADKSLLLEHLGWRVRPGILGKHPSSAQSVHALLGYFLRDPDSPTPFPGRDKLTHGGAFDWGMAPPLEKVIESRSICACCWGCRRSPAERVDRRTLAGCRRQSARRARPRVEDVAYMLQQVADTDSILYPVWRSGIAAPERLATC